MHFQGQPDAQDVSQILKGAFPPKAGDETEEEDAETRDRRARMEGSSAPGQDPAIPVSAARGGLESLGKRQPSGAHPNSEPHLMAIPGAEPRDAPSSWAETEGANP